MKIIYILLLCISLHAQKGVVLKPIIDLVGYPIADNRISYHNLPSAGGLQQSHDICPRTHQLLYNETVEIIKQTETEYCIKVPHLFYVTTNNGNPQSTFWTHKKNITLYSQLSKKAQSSIPEPYTKKKNTDQKILVLLKPSHNRRLSYTFSAGTRFICSLKNNNKRYFSVYAICPKTLQPITLKIPRSDAIIIKENDRQATQALFVTLLKSWAHLPGTIPYIWGGCSLTDMLHSDRFKEEFFNNIYNTHEHTTIKEQPKSGFDCTGLILRAAQAAGLPYYYKNSTTIVRYLKPVTSLDNLQEGDLIWIPGHIMAIADLKKNTIIEARHYNDGYGKVHEIKLNYLFKDIATFADLYDAIAQHKLLYRLTREGKVSKTIMQAKILSIDSCYT